jgi:hypothetical protein
LWRINRVSVGVEPWKMLKNNILFHSFLATEIMLFFLSRLVGQQFVYYAESQS